MKISEIIANTIRLLMKDARKPVYLVQSGDSFSYLLRE